MSIFKKVAATAILTVSVVLFTGCISPGTDPNAPSEDQTTNLSDKDNDGTPDVIDEDIDGDGIVNNNDTDIDGDGKQNTQDEDIDGDGTNNIDDNDIDGDGIINENDSDIDGDGIINTKDDDIDGDGIKNIDDNDIDGDGIINTQDDDIDGDGIKNTEDNDIDGDGILNNDDKDIDGDGIINSQDDDIDNDGTPNSSDTTPGGTTNTTTNGTQGTSNTGSDQNSGTTNTGSDKNSGSTSDDATASGVAITVTDTLDYTLKIDAGTFNGSITQSEVLKLDDLRKKIIDNGVALQSFSFLDMRVTGSASGAFLQQNGNKKIILSVFYTDATGSKVNIFQSSPSSNLAPLLTLNDLTKGINLNDQIRVSLPGFPNFVAMIKDQSIAQLQTGAELTFVDPITATTADINLTCALKISGIAKL